MAVVKAAICHWTRFCRKRNIIVSILTISCFLFIATNKYLSSNAINLLVLTSGFNNSRALLNNTDDLIYFKNLSTITNHAKFTNAISSIPLKKIESSNSTNETDPACGYYVRSPLPRGTRLGNHLFMYASFYGMVKKQNVFGHKTAFIQVRNIPSYLDTVFDGLSIPQKIISDSWINEKSFSYQNEMKMCAYDSAGFFQLACDGQNVIVNGYRQSYKYFDTDFEEIKKEFTFKKSIQKSCTHLFKQNLHTKGGYVKCTTVGVHLRRGDFALGGEFWPAQIDYLKRAIQYHEVLHFERNIKKIVCLVFMIFGDDYNWNLMAIREVQFLRPNDTYSVLIDSRKSSPEIDLCMMQLCDHMIISTGTFSWWSGFFSRGAVTYQKEYAKLNSSLYFQYEPKDFYLPHWIPL